MNKSDCTYEINISTRWEDNDQFRHVNNVKYYSYFDTLVNHFLIKQNILAKDIEKNNIKGFVVETNCKYFFPISFPDEIQAGLIVDHIGNSSVRYKIGIFFEEKLCAEGFFVHVYVDSKTNKPQTLSKDIKAILEKFR